MNFKEKELGEFYADFDPNIETMGVVKVSIVEYPAIESNFVALSKEQKIFLSSDNEKQTITGALIIPDKKILRSDPTGDYYNLIFTTDTIEKLRDKFHKDNFTHEVNLDHQTDVKGVYLVESWIKKSDKDKSVEMGLDVPIGTWLATYKIEDKTLFDKVKTKEYNGFSIEAFLDTNIKIKKEKTKMKKNMFLSVLAKLAELVSVKGAIPELDIDYTDNENESNINLPEMIDKPIEDIVLVPEKPEEVAVEQTESQKIEAIYAQHQTLLANYTNLLVEMETLKARIDVLESTKMEVEKEKEDVMKEKDVISKEKEEVAKENDVLKEKLSKIEDEDAVKKLKIETKASDVPKWKSFAENLRKIV